MTSQARAELNAAAAARARILNGNRNWELSDNRKFLQPTVPNRFNAY